MSNSLLTKKAIAAAFKKVMETTAFEEIAVLDIAAACGISRRTFYYHFKDKYDLVQWIFQEEIIPDILAATTMDHWQEGSLSLCVYLQKNKEFYVDLLRSEGQNSLKEYLYTLTEKQVSLLITEVLDGKQISDEDLKFIIDYYYYAFIGILSVWAQQNMQTEPKLIVDRWETLVGKNLHDFVNQFSK